MGKKEPFSFFTIKFKFFKNYANKYKIKYDHRDKHKTTCMGIQQMKRPLYNWKNVDGYKGVEILS